MNAHIAALALGICTLTTQVASANSGEEQPRSGPILNDDWYFDQLSEIGEPSDFSPYEFTLSTPAYFRITDSFVLGDTFTVTDALLGSLGATIDFGPRPATLFGTGQGEESWRSGEYRTLQVLLAPGTYSLTVTGDGAGGLPAGFYTQLEVVPTPAGGAAFLLAAAAACRRRRA